MPLTHSHLYYLNSATLSFTTTSNTIIIITIITKMSDTNEIIAIVNLVYIVTTNFRIVIVVLVICTAVVLACISHEFAMKVMAFVILALSLKFVFTYDYRNSQSFTTF